MKVLIDFAPGPRLDRYVGTRLRKNLKGALELSGTNWVESMFAEPDIVHYLSPEDEGKANEAHQEGAKVVVSALYSEADQVTRFLSRGNDGFPLLKGKAERLLEGADLVLVPSEKCVSILREAGLNNPSVQVLTPGVNLARFDVHSDIEKSIFRRYFRLEPEIPYCLSSGSLEDEKRIAILSELASALPSLNFYYLGVPRKGPANHRYLKRKNKKTPRNLVISDIVEDDVYRSGVFGALAYLSFASNDSDEMMALEAMAAKTTVLALGTPNWSNALLEGKGHRLLKDLDGLQKAISSLSRGRGSKTIIEGYREAKARSLEELGTGLLALYRGLLYPGRKETR